MEIVEALLGLQLWPKQKEIIKTFYEGGYRELVLCVGMRGSKSFLTGVICAIETARYLMLPDPWTYYGIQRQDVHGFMTAVNERQAKRTVFMFYKNILKNSWWFKNQRMIPTELSVSFPDKQLIVQAIPSSAAGQAGGTLLFSAMDELARFVETSGARSGNEVYATLSKGTETLKGKIISISSPLYVHDKIIRLLDDAKKEAELSVKQKFKPRMLAYHLPTWELNPNIKRSPDLDRDFAMNPEQARRDWEAIPSYAIEPFIRRPEAITIDASRRNPTISPSGQIDGLKAIPGVLYYAHIDPSTVNDALGLAVAHQEGDRIIVDLVHRIIPRGQREINASEVKAVLMSIHRILRLKLLTRDQYSFQDATQALQEAHVPIDNLTIKKEQYDNLKELFYADPIRISVPDHVLDMTFPTQPETVIQELQELELVKGEKVDHRSTSSKDVADALAGACWPLRASAARRRFNRLPP